MLPIVLGSKSVGRREILTKMGYRFTLMDPNIDEKAIRHPDPKRLVVALALAKTQAILPQLERDVILITADQVVRCHGKILEKPKNSTEAYEFLQLHSQHPVETITAVAVTNTLTQLQEYGVDIATIWFHPIPQSTMVKLAQQKYVLHCAGGFSIDDPVLKQYIAKIIGTTTSITGLPQELTQQLISKARKNS